MSVTLIANIAAHSIEYVHWLFQIHRSAFYLAIFFCTNQTLVNQKCTISFSSYFGSLSRCLRSKGKDMKIAPKNATRKLIRVLNLKRNFLGILDVSFVGFFLSSIEHSISFIQQFLKPNSRKVFLPFINDLDTSPPAKTFIRPLPPKNPTNCFSEQNA